MFAFGRHEFGHELPIIGAFVEIAFFGVLDPDHRDIAGSGAIDEFDDIGDHRVPIPRIPNDSVLHIDDDQGMIRAILKCGHSATLLCAGASSSPALR